MLRASKARVKEAPQAAVAGLLYRVITLVDIWISPEDLVEKTSAPAAGGGRMRHLFIEYHLVPGHRAAVGHASAERGSPCRRPDPQAADIEHDNVRAIPWLG